MVCFRYVIVNTVHKDGGGGGGGGLDDDDNISAMRAACPIFITLLELIVRKMWRKLKIV
jgi:hypothetical protein